MVSRDKILGWVPLACSVLLFPRTATSTTTTTEEWVTQQDREALRKAGEAVDLYCAGGFKGTIDRESGRAVLENGVGGSNTMLDIMKASNGSAELGDKAAKKMNAGWIVGRVASVGFAILLGILWHFCCWSACPCCKCCRCGAKVRKTHIVVKFILLGIGFALTFGVIFAAAYGRSGYTKAVDGFDNMACTSAKLLNGTLGGQASPYFIGMMPLLEEFKGLEQSLAYDSPMMANIRQQLDATAEVSDSMYLASETLALLKDVLITNLPADVAVNLHECPFCTITGDLVDEISKVLGAGAGSALSQARIEIDKQLSEENSKSLQDTFKSAADPIVAVKVLIRDTFGFFTDKDKFLQVRGHLAGKGPNTIAHITGLVVTIAVFLVAFMQCSLLTFAFRERAGKPEEGGPKPFSKIPHRIACCTWCCGWLFMVIALLVGGLMTLVGVPLSGMCLIMDDMSAELITNIGPALGLNLTGDEGEQLLDIVSNCLVPKDPNLNAALLDLIYVKDNATAPKESLREKVVESVKDSIRSKFDDIDKSMGGGSAPALSTDPKLVKLTDAIYKNPISMMIVAKDLTSDSTYSDLYSQTALSAAALPSSVQCNDRVVSDEVDGLKGKTMKGVEKFVLALTSFGTRQTLRADCANLVDCVDALTSPRGKSCKAGNNFVKLKQKLMDAGTFRCDTFVNPLDGVSACDVKFMSGTFNASKSRTMWSNDCLSATKKVKRKQVLCNVQEFSDYVKDYKTRILQAMKRIDLAVTEVGPAISKGLRGIVEEDLIAPIDRVANGVTCGLMGGFYREMVDGFCYQGINGFIVIGQSYVACGAMLVFLVLLMYGVWRRAIDNVNKSSVALTKVVEFVKTDGVLPTAPMN